MRGWAGGTAVPCYPLTAPIRIRNAGITPVLQQGIGNGQDFMSLALSQDNS
jgi:hypothetical protein